MLQRRLDRNTRHPRSPNHGDRWIQTIEESATVVLGWPSCNAIQADGCTDCATCPHLSKGNALLHWTVPAAVTAPVANAAALLAANPSPVPASRWPGGQNSQTGMP